LPARANGLARGVAKLATAAAAPWLSRDRVRAWNDRADRDLPRSVLCRGDAGWLFIWFRSPSPAWSSLRSTTCFH